MSSGKKMKQSGWGSAVLEGSGEGISDKGVGIRAKTCKKGHPVVTQSSPLWLYDIVFCFVLLNSEVTS